MLFSPHDPANRLFPPQRVLDEVLDLLNSEELQDIWAEDETIGWVYQYFTPKELRDQARKESRRSAQFLRTGLPQPVLHAPLRGRVPDRQHAGPHLVRDAEGRHEAEGPVPVHGPPPHRSLLERRAKPPGDDRGQDDLSQEELLKQPVHIPHRPKKDPRELRVLDPACGSGHFLLYCFDLLLTIYEEAYADPDLGRQPAGRLPDAGSPAARCAPPDPRSQPARHRHRPAGHPDRGPGPVAACQRPIRTMGLKRRTAPKITRSNIVCAEPMPGEERDAEGVLSPTCSRRSSAKWWRSSSTR